MARGVRGSGANGGTATLDPPATGRRGGGRHLAGGLGSAHHPATAVKANFKQFQTMGDASVHGAVASFLTKLGPERLISMTTEPLGIIVWFWDSGSGAAGL